MNPPNKKPGAIGIQQSLTRQIERARQLKPPVAQSKNVSASPSVGQRVAPTVYRPQAKPSVMQQKSAGSHLVKTHPSAPPVYRPQPIPKALQAKKVGSQQPHPKQLERKVAAPPVYRPQHKKIVQPKVVATAQTRMPAKTLPYAQASLRPAQQTPARPGSLKMAEIRGVPPHERFRPQMTPAQFRQNPVAQAKSGSMFSTRMGARINGRRYVPQGAKIIQAKWIPFRDGIRQWDAPLDGVTWYADDQGEMWFEVADAKQIRKGNLQDYQSMAGAQRKRTWDAWRAAGAEVHEEPAPADDDIVSAMMKLGKEVKWEHASYATGPPGMKKRPFYKWLFDQNPQEPCAMNCWEAVLFSACKAGVKNQAYIKKAIKLVEVKGDVDVFAAGGGMNKKIQLVTKILGSPTTQKATRKEHEKIAKLPDIAIPKNYVVLFGASGEHVALSTGTLAESAHGIQEHGILELDQVTSGVVTTTVEEVMRRNPAYSSLVSWGPFPAL